MVVHSQSVQALPHPVWFSGLMWESGAIVALNALDALTTVVALSLGAIELNGIAAFLLSGGPAAFLSAKLLFAGWVVIGLAFIQREWPGRWAKLGAHATIAVLVVVVSWNGTMLAVLARAT